MTSTRSGTRGRRYRGASSEQRRSERRARFVDAAVEVYGTRGYRHASVERVCAEAGLTKRYFYESFANSEALLLAAHAHAVQRLRDRVLASASAHAPDVAAMAAVGIEAFFVTVRDDPRLARLVLFEVLGVSPAVDAAYREAIQSFVGLLVMLARSAETDPAVSDDDGQVLAIGLIGAGQQIATEWVLSGYALPIETIVGNTRTLFTAIVRHVGRAA